MAVVVVVDKAADETRAVPWCWLVERTGAATPAEKKRRGEDATLEEGEEEDKHAE
jgi:hypothetical protein